VGRDERTGRPVNGLKPGVFVPGNRRKTSAARAPAC